MSWPLIKGGAGGNLSPNYIHAGSCAARISDQELEKLNH
jgi:hypothetical protein